MEKMTPQKEKKRPSTRRKGPSNEEKSTIHYFFFKGGGRVSLPAPPPGWPLSKSNNKMNIFTNYSAHNYIKIHSRMHPVALFHKKIPR